MTGRAKVAPHRDVTLHAGEAEVIFQPSFDALAEAGTLLYNEQKWGASVRELVTFLRHSPQAAALKALGQSAWR
jgi:hypothetical protein